MKMRLTDLLKLQVLPHELHHARELTKELASMLADAHNKITWLPIDTAPKDGTIIWLGNASSRRIGMWLNDRWADFHAAEFNQTRQDILFTPTHWLALPDLPNTSLHGQRKKDCTYPDCKCTVVVGGFGVKLSPCPRRASDPSNAGRHDA